MQVYSQSIEQQVFGGGHDALDKGMDLFLKLCEGQFHDSLPLSKFWRVLDYSKKIGKKPVKRIDFELIYKKLTAGGRQMDFALFWTALTTLVDVFDDSGVATLQKKLDRFFKSLSDESDR